MHLLQFFNFSHLPPKLQEISKKFYETAHFIFQNTPENPEQTMTLRKLLEAKDCAVRSLLFSNTEMKKFDRPTIIKKS